MPEPAPEMIGAKSVAVPDTLYAARATDARVAERTHTGGKRNHQDARTPAAVSISGPMISVSVLRSARMGMRARPRLRAHSVVWLWCWVMVVVGQ